MRLRFFGFASPEDRFEKWIAQRHQERVLAGDTIATGPCPDDAFLKDLAKQSDFISLDDPQVKHAANCPICMRRLFKVQDAQRSRRRLKLVFVATAALVVFAAFLLFGMRRRGALTEPQLPEVAAISESVDLSNAGTFRGDQLAQLQAVSLPAALVKVTIVLPRYSDPGRYAVAVTRDQRGDDLIARATGLATGGNAQIEVSVYLDLRKSRPGSYFLSTTHEQDQASYYYPLQIK